MAVSDNKNYTNTKAWKIKLSWKGNMEKGFYYDEYYDALVIYTGFRNVYQYDHENGWFKWNDSFFNYLNRLEFIGK